MGVGKWFKETFGFGDIDDELENEFEDELQDDDEPIIRPVENKKDRSREREKEKIVINATTQLEVVLVKPERFEEASAIADHLISKRTVVLNLESTNKDVTRRLIDFLSGVAYANSGQLKRVANSTFIITPYNVGIVGDLLDELESSGVYF